MTFDPRIEDVKAIYELYQKFFFPFINHDSSWVSAWPSLCNSSSHPSHFMLLIKGIFEKGRKIGPAEYWRGGTPKGWEIRNPFMPHSFFLLEYSLIIPLLYFDGVVVIEQA